jgi:diguanylate cyclase (GGDEF)-like protein/PAS domain S-box-containing protein
VAVPRRSSANRRGEGQIDASVRLELVHAVALAASESTTPDSAMRIGLEEICLHTGWPVGHVCVMSERGGDLVSGRIWHLPSSDDVAAFREATESLRFAPGVGLPGRALAARRPVWVRDLSQEDWPRRWAAEKAGIRSGIAFPAVIGPHVVAVLEFFSADIAEPDVALLEAMAHVGALFGRVVERKEAEHALRKSEALKGAMLEAALDCIITADHKGRIIDFNPAAEKTFGYARAEVGGNEIAQCIVPPSLRADHRAGLERFLETGEGAIIGRRVEVTAMRSDGSEFPLELAIHALQIEGHPIFTAYARDITSRKMMEARLEHQALHDSLTGLANRDLFMDRMEHALARTDRSDGCHSVIFLDLDGFKAVNDELGHAAGDELLVETARRVRDRVRPGDTVARLGGDEFAVLLEDTDEPLALCVVERIFEELDRPLRLEGKDVTLHASAGVASSSAGRLAADELLRRADEAMYGAKKAGPGHHLVFGRDSRRE